jgi:peptide/nickel transport system substrate-binding protein
MRTARFLAVLMMAVVLTVGAASAQTTLRIGLAEDPDILDPTLNRTFVARIVFASLCDKLVDINPELEIVPQLATEWHWVNDNKGLVMTLRRGVKFHDGEPMDAAAVKYSLERHLTMPGSNRKAELGPLKSVEIVDDHTVKLVLERPYAPLLAQLTDRAGMIVSPKTAEAEGDKFGEHPVCAGPFKFTERVAQDRIVLDRFADYWNKDAIHFDRVTFLPIPDATVRLANLQSGQLDLIERLAATDLDTAKKDSRLKTAGITSLAYNDILINTNNGERSKNPLGQDQRVREALEDSIDRDALNQVVFNGEFTPGNQWEAPSSPWYVKSMPIPPRDVVKARALLAAAGAPHPSFTLMVPNNTEPLRVAQVIQSMASEAGFDIKIQATEFASSLDLAQRGDFEAYLIGWSGRTDPDGNLYNFVACKAPPALNASRYCNAEVDAELDAERTGGTQEERMTHFAKIAAITLVDRPLIYLNHLKWLYAMSTRLTGFTTYPDGLIRPQGLEMK